MKHSNATPTKNWHEPLSALQLLRTIGFWTYGSGTDCTDVAFPGAVNVLSVAERGLFWCAESCQLEETQILKFMWCPKQMCLISKCGFLHWRNINFSKESHLSLPPILGKGRNHYLLVPWIHVDVFCLYWYAGNLKASPQLSCMGESVVDAPVTQRRELPCQGKSLTSEEAPHCVKATVAASMPAAACRRTHAQYGGDSWVGWWGQSWSAICSR